MFVFWFVWGMKAKLSLYFMLHFLSSGTRHSAEGRTERNNGCFYTIASKRQLACISRHIGSVLMRGWRALGTCTPPRLGGPTAPSIPHYKVICLKMLLVSLSFHLLHLTRKWKGSPRCSLLGFLSYGLIPPQTSFAVVLLFYSEQIDQF